MTLNQRNRRRYKIKNLNNQVKLKINKKSKMKVMKRMNIMWNKEKNINEREKERRLDLSRRISERTTDLLR